MSMTIHVPDSEIAEAMFRTEVNPRQVFYWLCREADGEDDLVHALCAGDLDETPARELGALLWRLFKSGTLG